MSQKSDDSPVEDLSVNRILCLVGLAVVAGLVGMSSCPKTSRIGLLNNLCNICFVGLTAGLPLNLPRHQIFEDPASLDRGDTAWMLISTILGLFLAPAIANFYGMVYYIPD